MLRSKRALVNAKSHQKVTSEGYNTYCKPKGLDAAIGAENGSFCQAALHQHRRQRYQQQASLQNALETVRPTVVVPIQVIVFPVLWFHWGEMGTRWSPTSSTSFIFPLQLVGRRTRCLPLSKGCVGMTEEWAYSSLFVCSLHAYRSSRYRRGGLHATVENELQTLDWRVRPTFLFLAFQMRSQEVFGKQFNSYIASNARSFRDVV